jgi:hypothetical protein
VQRGAYDAAPHGDVQPADCQSLPNRQIDRREHPRLNDQTML